MSFWPKSRYTASLEQQVNELKEQAAALRESLAESRVNAAALSQEVKHANERAIELKEDLAFERDQVRQLTVKLVEVSAKAVSPYKDDKKELPLPMVVNWLRARTELESPDIVTEAEPKEKTANGSR